MRVKQKRSRPFAYVLAGSETSVASRLRGLGVSVLRLDENLELDVERYQVTDVGETKKDDARRNDEDGTADILLNP